MVPEPVGHKGISARMSCTHMLNKGSHSLRSPVAGL
jgi:hypothetical protein